MKKKIWFSDLFGCQFFGYLIVVWIGSVDEHEVRGLFEDVYVEEREV